MGNALASEGHLDQASEHFAAAIRLKPDFAEAYNNLGNAFLSRGRFDDAIAQYSAALRIQPDYALARYGLGSALASQGRTREAIEQLARTVELSPDYTEALSGLAWMLATDGDAALRDGVRAVRLAERAREVSGGDNPLILDALAAAYAETGEYERAAQTARRAAELADPPAARSGRRRSISERSSTPAVFHSAPGRSDPSRDCRAAFAANLRPRPARGDAAPAAASALETRRPTSP